MVLRKPYKFLIKHFRFIHLIMTLISGYLLLRTNALINFYNDYINNSETLIGTGTSNEYFTSLMIVSCFIILAGSLIILLIMRMKDKPILFYIINIVAYIFISTIYLYDNSIIQKLELTALDIRTIKLASDLTLICFLIQMFSTIILAVRAIGFNLRKFNFEQDLKFDIDEKDNEEFEFDVDIDKNKIKRNINKKIRDFKYTYHENKFMINAALLVLLVIIGIFIYLNFFIFHKVYKQNQIIRTNDISFSVSNSYLINTNYKNKQITNNYLLVAKLRIKRNFNDKITFEPARVLLHIGKVRFNPTTKFDDAVVDLGNVYNKEKLTDEFNDYLLVFEIPKKYLNKKKIFTYSDPYKGDFKIKLSSSKFNKSENVSSKLASPLKINNELINNIDLTISNYLIEDRIKATYIFCETTNNCYQSYEYIVPTLSDNYDKSILKIEGSIGLNDKSVTNFKDISDFIENFGSIKYTIDGKEKLMSTKIKEVQPIKSKKKNIYYFEVYDEIKHASKISLVINIRNSVYEYVLKG